MSGAYAADGKRRSSMTHARRGHDCSICDRRVFGNGAVVSHGRAHVRKGEAVELVKTFDGLMAPARFFLRPDDAEKIARYIADGYTEEKS